MNIGKSYYLEKWNVCPWSASIYTRQWTKLKWFYSHAWLDLSWEYRDLTAFRLTRRVRSTFLMRFQSITFFRKSWDVMKVEIRILQKMSQLKPLSHCLLSRFVSVGLAIADFKRVVLEDCMLLIYCTIIRGKFVSLNRSLFGRLNRLADRYLIYRIWTNHHCTSLHLL